MTDIIVEQLTKRWLEKREKITNTQLKHKIVGEEETINL